MNQQPNDELQRLVDIGLLDAPGLAALRKAGFQDLQQIVETWRDPSRREQALEAGELSAERFKDIAACANILSIRGPGQLFMEYNLRQTIAVNGPETPIEEQYAQMNADEIIQYVGSMWQVVLKQKDKGKDTRQFGCTMMALIGGILGLLAWAMYQTRHSLWPAPSADPFVQMQQMLDQSYLWMIITLGIGFTLSLSFFCWAGAAVVYKLRDRSSALIDQHTQVTPRDLIITKDALLHLPKWQRLLLGKWKLVFLPWAAGMVGIVWLARPADWFSYATLLIYFLFIAWIMLNLKLLNTGYNRLPKSWGEGARRRLALPSLLETTSAAALLCVFILAVGAFARLDLAALQALGDRRMAALETSAARLIEQSPAAQHEQMQTALRLKEGQWANQKANDQNFVDQIMRLGFQISRIGMLGLFTALALGWFLFIERSGWALGLGIIVVTNTVEEFMPGALSWLASGPIRFNPQLVGGLLGLAWVVMVEVFEKYRKENLTQECPQCFRLWPKDALCCSACGERHLREVLPFLEDAREPETVELGE